MVADSHNDNLYLKKALSQTKQDPQIKFIIGLGDYTEVGTIDELKNAKKELDDASIRYFLTVGDHDLWDARNKGLPATANFNQLFGPAYQSFSFENFYFILLFNSDNYQGVDEDQMRWLQQQLQKAKQEGRIIFIFTHEPLYHPSSDHVMGRVEGNLKIQAKNLIRTLKDWGVSKVFSGDTHYFSQYSEPETGLIMVTVGALTSQRNVQAPRFAKVLVYENGDTQVEDVEIK